MEATKLEMYFDLKIFEARRINLILVHVLFIATLFVAEFS